MLDGLDEAIERADGYAELDFSKGMLVLVNNHTTLHARTGSATTSGSAAACCAAG